MPDCIIILETVVTEMNKVKSTWYGYSSRRTGQQKKVAIYTVSRLRKVKRPNMEEREGIGAVRRVMYERK